MFSHSTDLICTEPSPKTPTEKFFDSETSKLSMPDETATMSGGSECGSSPLSEASSSGYESMLDENSQPDNIANNHDIIDEVYSTPAPRDHDILHDLRVPRQMLKIEGRYVPWNVDVLVYRCSKHETDEKARRIVTEWMLEVCEELKCEEVIFPLAVNYLDRFLLATPDLRKYQLQLVAVVCLLVASKLRQCDPLDTKALCYMTENSVTISQILSWEPLILKRLDWDVSSVLATDYLDHILVKLPELCAKSHLSHDHHCSFHPTATDSAHTCSSNILSQSHPAIARSTKRPLESSSPCPSPHFSASFSPLPKRLKTDHHSSSSSAPISLHETVRRHASTLITLCSTELQFACVRPSVIAAACVATAVRGIFQRSKLSHSIASTLASFSAQLQIEIDSDNINFYVNRIEALLAMRSSKLGACQSNSSESTAASGVIDSKSNSALSSSKTSPEVTLLPSFHSHALAQLPHPQLVTSAHSVHSPIHSNTGYCPNACLSSTATSVHSPRYSPAYHYYVPTAQMVSAKQLLLVQQQQPQNRVHPRHYIPAASALLRCSHPSVAHLHDSSNTSSAITSGTVHFDNGVLKSKLVTLNLPSTTTSSVGTSSNGTFGGFSDEEDRENMAPVSFVVVSGGAAASGNTSGALDSDDSNGSTSANSDLTSSEEMPDFLDDEDETLHDLYFSN